MHTRFKNQVKVYMYNSYCYRGVQAQFGELKLTFNPSKEWSKLKINITNHVYKSKTSKLTLDLTIFVSKS